MLSKNVVDHNLAVKTACDQLTLGGNRGRLGVRLGLVARCRSL